MGCAPGFPRLLLLILPGLAGAAAVPGLPLPPTRLRVEYLDSPLTIDVAAPRFSWALAHTGRAQFQAAYRLLVASEPSGTLLWDSGVVPSNRSVNVAYGGPALPSDADFSWRVQWTDALGATSAPARGTFSTALLGDASDWLGAAWLSSPGGGSLNTFRAEFALPAAPVRARLYVSGLGYAKTWLNGALTDNHELGPATVFHRRVLYDCVDVAPLLRAGANALGLMLGRGWWASAGGNSSTDWSGVGPRQFLLLLSVTHADNTTARFVSALAGAAAAAAGGSGASPLLFNATVGPVSDPTLIAGEAFDGRVAAALAGWSAPNYVPRAGLAWSPATAPAVSPATLGAALSAHSVVARARKDFAPVSVTQPRPGLFAFDFGQNMMGVVTLRAPPSGCPPGTLIALQLTETLSRDGVPTNQFCERPKQYLCAVQQRANYTCAGAAAGGESYRVTLSSMGFRYAALEGWPAGAPPPTADALTATFVHADVEEIGNFSSSSPLLNAIQRATVASVLSNLADYPTDCPTRERRGWMDANHVVDTVLRAVDGGALYSKWVRDFADAAAYASASFGAAGALPDVVPFFGGGQPDADPAWGLAAWAVPAALASLFDDEQLEAWWYPTARAYTEHWVGLAQAHGGAPNVSRYGDWGNMWGAGMPQPFIVPEHAPFFYALALDAQAGAASRLGFTADAARYGALAAGARALLLARFDAATGCFSNCSATSQVFGLAAGVLPAGGTAHGAAWARALAIFGPNGTFPERYGGGEISLGYFFSLLEGAGLQGLALRTQLHTDKPPSPGFWVAQGATTLWEYWENTATTSNAGLNSFNHIMYGAPGAFYYSSLAGLRRAPGSRSWRSLLLSPPGSASGVWASLTAASAQQSTPMGAVAVAWALGGGGARYAFNATLPPGAVATLALPTLRAAGEAVVEEGGARVWAGGSFVPGTPGVVSAAAGEDGQSVVFGLGSGDFAFTTQ